MFLTNPRSQASLNLDEAKNANIRWDKLLTAAQSHEYANDLTHPLYRYPARMSPQLAGALIDTFTAVGDTVLDPFSGGGTTAVEALYRGRRAICGDLNALACLITRAKAWPLSKTSLESYSVWALSEVKRLQTIDISESALLYQNLPASPHEAPILQNILREVRDRTAEIKDNNSRRLALLTTLRVGQICFDCRQIPPTLELLSKSFEIVTQLVRQRMKSYADTCRQFFGARTQQSLRVYHTDAEGIVDHAKNINTNPISLILTSPPYPGVKVLYHRWQIRGRKQTDLPYDLVNLNDGYFASRYTFGALTQVDNTYFEKLKAIFVSLRRLASPSTTVAQVIGFTDPEKYLGRYREVMIEAGFQEVLDPASPETVISRVVPHRRWYTHISKEQTSRYEYLLIHRIANE